MFVVDIPIIGRLKADNLPTLRVAVIDARDRAGVFASQIGAVWDVRRMDTRAVVARLSYNGRIVEVA